jgi:OOP family OmpA-OmpF porin
MKIRLLALLGLTAAVAAPAAAQNTAQPADTNTSNSLQMPYQSSFWSTGHVGAAFGRGRSDIPCPAGGSCDSNTNAFKVFGGGRFNNTIGGEVTYLKTGEFARSPGGDIDMQALNFGLLAGIPLPRNSTIFGKLGVSWGHTEAAGSSQNGWGPSIGAGAMIGLTRSFALRADWDRWRFKLPGGGGDRENIDTFMLGAQYTFGGPR